MNKHFIQELLSSNAFLEKDYPLALTETFLKMDDLLQDPQNKPELKSLGDFNDDKGNEPNNEENNSGCTANVILLVGNHLYTANVGDSRSVIYEDGNFIELSFDHKPHKEEEKNRILKSGGSVIKGRINGDISVSRAIGDFEYKKNSNIGREEQLMIATPEITQRILNEKSEFILMGCDGIWETKKTEKIMKIVAENLKTKKISLRIIAENLLDRLIAKDGEGFEFFVMFFY